MKITYLLAALLLVSSFATQATAHMRTSKSNHCAHVRTYSLHRGIPLARSGVFNSYGSSPNDPTSIKREPGVQVRSLPRAPKDDWPANMILDSFRPADGVTSARSLLR
jgi:hypothetical protein